jgi:uncharacterized protein
VALSLRRLLIGEDGKLQPLWRALLFFALGRQLLFPYLLDPLFGTIYKRLGIAPELSAQAIFFDEFELFIGALLLTGLFALYEGRRVDSYGLPIRQAFGRLFWEGAAVGFVWPALVALGMILLGGMQIHGFAISGRTLVEAIVFWGIANVTVGIAEEMWYRGYLLQTLWKGIGFWPAAILLSALFASDHYFYKTGENLFDVASLIGFNLLVCYTVFKTGSLWFGVGLHVAFDFTQLFIIGTKNGNYVPVHHLLNATFPGPAWLTGGVLGTEASVLMYPLFVLAFAYVWWRFRPAAEGTGR